MEGIKNLTIVPPQIDQVVLNFCKTIVDEEPYYVDVRSESYAEINECFLNIERKIKEDGGKKIIGWQLWTWPNKFIEAEFHAIWVSDNNEKIDITPKIDAVNKILFLPDKNKKYEGKNINNIKFALSQNGLIPIFFKINDLLFCIQNYKDRAGKQEIRLQGDEVEIFNWLSQTKLQLQYMLIKEFSLNSRCPCGSDQKYKRCCQNAVIDSINFIRDRYKEV